MSRLGQTVKVKAPGGEGQWYLAGGANCGGVPGEISFTAVAGDIWMLWGALDSYTGAWVTWLGDSYQYVIRISDGGPVSFTAISREEALVMHLTTMHIGD